MSLDQLNAARTLLLTEQKAALDALASDQVDAALDHIQRARRIFTTGAGRSGLAMRMAAMRLMHLGLSVYVVGETTTPAIGPGDLLIAASASGTTASVLHAAQVASRSGAAVLTLTTATDSPLASLSTAILHIPAASKADTAGRASQQYAGSLFEQAVLLTTDTLFHMLWKSGTQSAEDLLHRHANLE